MSRFTTLSIVLATATSLGCDSSDRPEPEDAKRTVSRTEDALKRTGADVRQGAQVVASKVKDGTHEVGQQIKVGAEEVSIELQKTKEDAVNASKQKLVEMDRELEELDQKAKETGRAVETDVRKIRQNAKQQLEKLEQASDGAWEGAKSGTAEALRAFERAIVKAREKLEAE